MKTDHPTDLGAGTIAGMIAVVILFGFLWLAATTPNLDNLPEYDCRPGEVHTTAECR